MPRFQCPQCGSVVVAQPGGMPVCGACGFGAEAGQDVPDEAAPGDTYEGDTYGEEPTSAAYEDLYGYGDYPGEGDAASPGDPYASEAPTETAPTAEKKGMGGGAIAAIVIVALLLVGGAIFAALWFGTDVLDGVFGDDDGDGDGDGDDGSGNGGDAGGGSAVTQAQADAWASEALVALEDAFARGDVGDISSFNLMVTGLDEGASVNATITVEWGLGNASIVMIHAVRDGEAFDLEAYCLEDGAFLDTGGEVYEARTPDPAECQIARGGNGSFAQYRDVGPAIADLSDTSGLMFTQATPHPDGTVSVTYIDGDGNALDADLDDEGRPVQMETDGDDGSATMMFGYGDRRNITAPEATAQLPADVTLEPADAQDTWNQPFVLRTPQTGLKRAEFEVRIYDRDTGDLWTYFNLGTHATQQKGVGMSWDEGSTLDPEGTFVDGDRIRIVDQDGDNVLATWDVVLWDTTVDSEAGTSPIPGPSALVAAVALLAALVLRHRPQRP